MNILYIHEYIPTRRIEPDLTFKLPSLAWPGLAPAGLSCMIHHEAEYATKVIPFGAHARCHAGKLAACQ